MNSNMRKSIDHFFDLKDEKEVRLAKITVVLCILQMLYLIAIFHPWCVQHHFFSNEIWWNVFADQKTIWQMIGEWIDKIL